METCVICFKVKVKGVWKNPNLIETKEVQRGLAVMETVCPNCSPETFTQGAENALQAQM
jgi:hypothetical protein